MEHQRSLRAAYTWIMKEKDPYLRKADYYNTGRPPYSKKLLEKVILDMGLQKNMTVADIGSGTGNLAEHFLGKAANIYAVEPSDDMRRVQEEKFSLYPEFISLKGTANKTGLESSSVDLLVVGQALHWFEEDAPLEFQRIIRPSGKILVVWNDFGNQPPSNIDSYLNVKTKKELREKMSFTEDWETYLAGHLSASYAPREEDDAYTLWMEQKKLEFENAAIDQKIVLQYVTVALYGLPVWHNKSMDLT